MQRTLVAMRTMLILLLLLGIGSVCFGLYHALVFPVDYGNQQALSHAVACSTSVSPNCTRTVRAVVVQVINDGRNEGTLIAQVGNHQVSLDAIQSYNTMARLYVTEPITLLKWRGHYVRVITRVGSFDTTANPSNAVYLDLAFGIGGLLLGGFLSWMFGRTALGPLFLALGWRQLATSDDRARNDLQHGIIPAGTAATSRRSVRWMARYERWDKSHPMLSTLLTMAFTTAVAAARIWGRAGGWGGPEGFSDTPHWPLILGIAAALGLVVSLASRRRMRQTSAEIHAGEQLRERLAEVSAWPDGPDKHAALLEVAQSLQAMAGRRRARPLRSPRDTPPGP